MRMPEMERKEWQEPRIVCVGDVAEVVQGGDGKLSIAAADSGDEFKPPGGEP